MLQEIGSRLQDLEEQQARMLRGLAMDIGSDLDELNDSLQVFFRQLYNSTPTHTYHFGCNKLDSWPIRMSLLHIGT
jgi:hypothetical protein